MKPSGGNLLFADEPWCHVVVKQPGPNSRLAVRGIQTWLYIAIMWLNHGSKRITLQNKARGGIIEIKKNWKFYYSFIFDVF